MSEIAFRPFRLDDAEALTSWASTADELLQWTGPGFSFPLDRRQLRDHAAGAGERRRLVSATAGRSEAVVAHAQLDVLAEHDLGRLRRIAVAPERRGEGIGSALMDHLLALGFEQLGLHRLELVVFSFNEPARRCYRRAGFEEEGIAREARRSSDGYWDLVQMALLEERYREHPPARE